MVGREISIDTDKIFRLMKEHGLTIHGLETKAELGNGTIRKWDRVVPDLKSLFNVAEALGIDFWKLTIIKEKERGQKE